MFYSASARGFFPSMRTGSPSDLVEISQEYYAQLLASQTAELEIAPDENGYPVIAPRKLTYQQALSQLNSVYQQEIEGFKQAFSLAYLADGVSQESKQAAIRGQYEARKTLHIANIAALKAQYGTGV